MEKFDVVVIGAGVGGMACGEKLSRGGKRVAVVENDLWGGTCPNRGCDPKKVLVGGVETQARMRQLQGKGFAEVPEVDWAQLQQFKRTFTDPASESFHRSLQQSGVETIRGQAVFLDAHRLQVGERELFAEQIVIATGQHSRILEIPGQEYLQTSTDFLSFSELPKRIVFLGAGYIAFELATIAASCGSQVTIIHHNERPLKAFAKDLVADMVNQMTQRGIDFIWDTEVSAVEKMPEGLQVSGDDLAVTCDAVICATGRVPNVAELQLEQAGVAYSAQGIAVDEHLRTNLDHIYACGDVIAKKIPKLTPVATFEGSYVADVILGKTEAIDYPVIPTIVYGSPKLAQVGLTAPEDVTAYKSQTMELTKWFTYRRANEAVAKVQLVKDNEGKLVGATVLSETADELINYLMLVLAKEITAADLEKMIIGYPTVASDLPYLI